MVTIQMSKPAFHEPKGPRLMCAMRILIGEDGRTMTGALTEIKRPTSSEICGQGFNDKTVKVRLGDDFYFVFRDDIQP